MKKLNAHHLYALARAESFMQSGITPQMSDKHKRFIEDDITFLNEVRSIVRIMIAEPGLPLLTIPDEPVEIERKIGNAPSMSPG